MFAKFPSCLFDSPITWDIISQWDESNLINFLKENTAEKGKALFPACGSGRVTSQLQEHFAKIDAFDINPKMVHYASKFKQDPGVRYFEADMASFIDDQVQAEQYDAVIVVCNSFRYLLNYLDCRSHLAQACTALKNGGKYFIELGLNESPKDVGLEIPWRVKLLDRSKAIKKEIKVCWKIDRIESECLVDKVTLQIFESGIQTLEHTEYQKQRIWTMSTLHRELILAGFRKVRFFDSSFQPVKSFDGVESSKYVVEATK